MITSLLDLHPSNLASLGLNTSSHLEIHIWVEGHSVYTTSPFQNLHETKIIGVSLNATSTAVMKGYLLIRGPVASFNS